MSHSPSLRNITVEGKTNLTATLQDFTENIWCRRYTGKVEQYAGDILLIGVSYGKGAKQRSCVIETVTR